MARVHVGSGEASRQVVSWFFDTLLDLLQHETYLGLESAGETSFRYLDGFGRFACRSRGKPENARVFRFLNLVAK
jgi:hypothetical protein